MSTLHLSRKEREKLARQQEILAAARQLFLTHGYHETTLEEIARHAEFGKGTLYNYFSSKEELFLAIQEQLLTEFENRAGQVFRQHEKDSRQALLNYARLVMTQARDNADLISLIMQKKHQLAHHARSDNSSPYNKTMQKIWQSIMILLQADQAESRIKPYHPMTLAVLFDGMIRSYCFNRLRLNRTFAEQEIDDAAATIVSIFFDGIQK